VSRLVYSAQTPRRQKTEYDGALPDEHDFTLQYCQHVDPALTAWCVFQDGTVVFFDPVLDRAIASARRMAHDAGQAAWLISAGLTIRIPALNT
jgi:diketogulonate reductase-like aldo/keto reductase